MSVVEFSQQQKETVELRGATGTVESELDQQLWSVISFEKCEASGLTYSEAMAKLNDLERNDIAGLCIVTNDVAARLKTPK
jgi:hypothetical protein